MAPPAQAGWGGTFRFAQPGSLDVLAPQLAFSSSGDSAVAFGIEDADNPASAAGYAIWRAAGGRLSPERQVPAAQQVLDLAFDGHVLDLLTGASSGGKPCCSSASVVRMTGGGAFGAAQTVVRGLAGATDGQLVASGGRMVAALATERGVWVAQSSAGHRFGRVHMLSGSGTRPEALRTGTLAGGGAIVAWTAQARRSSTPRTIFAATGSARSAPRRAHPILTVPSGHQIDELAIAGDGAPAAPSAGPGPTIAWIESWYDRRGAYHSQVEVTDLGHAGQVRSFAIAGTIAADLSFAQDTRGDELLGWNVCDAAGRCSVRESTRLTGQRFAGPARLGSIDAAEAPAAALAPSREGLIGWIYRGHVLAADLRPGATRFLAAHTVSTTDYAADLTLAFGPARSAIAVWSQGTLAPDVVGAVYRPG